MLSVGESVVLPESGRTAQIVAFIGEGGQGTVFEALIDDTPVAIKWYFEHVGTDSQRQAVRDLIERGAPSDRFLWPSEMIELDRVPGFGYVMPLRPAEYRKLRDLFGRVDVDPIARTTLCRELAECFLSLHIQGLCYRDISFSNIFFEPNTGKPLICDNDNVGIDGRASTGVLGTRTFMAPEIIREEVGPSIDTDRWSLAVVLFYILVVGHPLLGRRELRFKYWNEESERELLGRAPLFVFDPDDQANAPDPVEHASMSINWRHLPVFVRRLFTKSFTEGLRDPRNGRIPESQWRRDMSRLGDSVVTCTKCGVRGFFDMTQPLDCRGCGRRIEPPLRLVFKDGKVLILSDGAKVYQHHVDRLPSYNFKPVAEVTRHPSNKDVWGLRNVDDQAWTATGPTGDSTVIAPTRSFGLVPGTVFRFGSAEARLEH